MRSDPTRERSPRTDAGPTTSQGPRGGAEDADDGGGAHQGPHVGAEGLGVVLAVVVLLLGGVPIAIAMQTWGLHRRIALRTLRAFGTHPRRVVLGTVVSTAVLSTWVSGTATTLMVLPVAMGVLTPVVDRVGSGSRAHAQGPAGSQSRRRSRADARSSG